LIDRLLLPLDRWQPVALAAVEDIIAASLERA
jgi:hypothetical protein